MYRIPCNADLNDANACEETDKAALAARNNAIPEFTDDYGIVICAGGPKYFPGAYVTIRMLRHLGCTLPVQVWHLGREEMPVTYSDLLKPLNATAVDGRELSLKVPHKRLGGWEIKCYAMVHSPWRHVCLIDADNLPLVTPEAFFSSVEYGQCGALFWPDRGRISRENNIWKLTGIPHQDEPEFESGQIFVDKKRHWAPLLLTNWFNENSEYWYSKFHGDKETFHLAWRKLNAPYFMHPPLHERGFGIAMYQVSATNNIAFQHGVKWSITGMNTVPPDYIYKQECLEYMEDVFKELRGKNYIDEIRPAGMVGKWVWDDSFIIFSSDHTVRCEKNNLKGAWEIKNKNRIHIYWEHNYSDVLFIHSDGITAHGINGYYNQITSVKVEA